MQKNLRTEALHKWFGAVTNCSKQVVNQNTNVATEICKVAGKRTPVFTVTVKWGVEIET